MFCTKEELLNESDVEQKFVWPLLTATLPNGLGYSSVDIRSKPDIRKLRIDKGKNNEKLYHPDYVILIAGIPVLVIEAKHPHEDPVAALREARLYAHALNDAFKAGVNPCVRVIATNGLLTVSSPADQELPDVELAFEDVNPTSIPFNKLVSLASRTTTQAAADRLRDVLVTRPFHRALNLIGGQSVRDEDVGYNTFGSRLSLDYRAVFKPETRKERAYIVRNAYVRSTRREHYVDEIDRIVATSVASTVKGAQLITDTESPRQLLDALNRGSSLENQVLLLVGGRGAGKTTFVDYIQELKLSDKLRESTVWVHLNLNHAPEDRTLQEQWALEHLMHGLKAAYSDIDFETRDTWDKVYSVELRRFAKISLANLKPGSEAYETRLADEIIRLQSDAILTAKAMCRYLVAEREHKLLIVVFDNCDKRNRDEQLAMFRAARWLQSEIRCLIFLPLRDVTYETYRDEPPLDTTIKDLVFRIDPPPFAKILRKRLDLIAADIAARSKSKMLEFTLDNSIRVMYPANELGYYLASIHRSLYEYDKVIRKLIVGLAGRDVRRAMEIFLEFCRSGHISAAEYLQMKAANGNWPLPRHVVVRVLLRRNRRYYDGNLSFLKNLFQCHPEDAHPDHFVRANILGWLEVNRQAKGPTGIIGFHQAGTVIAGLVPIGHDANRIREELKYLVEQGCILTEHQRPEIQSDNDLVRLSSAGWVHLQMLKDFSYLAACSEETWISSEVIAKTVANRIAHFGPKVHNSPTTTAANARDFIAYLRGVAAKDASHPEDYLEGDFVGVSTEMDEIAKRITRELRREQPMRGWKDVDERFFKGVDYRGTVVWIEDYGIFVRLDAGPKGLIHLSKLNASRPLTSFKINDRVIVRIERIEPEVQKLAFAFVADINDEDEEAK